MFHVLHHSYDHSLYVNDDGLSTDACSSMLRIRTCHVRQLGVVPGLGREANYFSLNVMVPGTPWLAPNLSSYSPRAC